MNWFVRSVYYAIRFVILSFIRLFLEFKVWGKKNIPARGPRIYCSNHFSSMDPFFAITLMKEPVHMVIGPAFSVSFIRRFLKIGQQINALPEFRHEVIDKAVSYLEKGESVYIFPEGDLNNQEQFLKFYNGVGRIYLKRPCPIVPIGILSPRRDVRGRLPGGEKDLRVFKPLTIFFGKYFANIGSPMRFPQYEKMKDKKKAAELITHILKRTIAKLVRDIKTDKFWR